MGESFQDFETDLIKSQNHKATKPAVHDGPSSARQRNAICMAFGWLADDGLLIVVVFVSSILSPRTCVLPWDFF